MAGKLMGGKRRRRVQHLVGNVDIGVYFVFWVRLLGYNEADLFIRYEDGFFAPNPPGVGRWSPPFSTSSKVVSCSQFSCLEDRSTSIRPHTSPGSSH